MQVQPSEPEPRTGITQFPQGQRATWRKVSPEASPHEVLHALALPRPRPLLLVLGGAEELEPALMAQLQPLFQGLARTALEASALILDGGTQSGVMAAVGQAMAALGAGAWLVGIAPEGRVTWPGGPQDTGSPRRVPLEPHHSHFILVEGETWGSETRFLFALAAALAAAPPVVVLASGGERAKQECLQAVHWRWPVVVLEGSGRLADELAHLVRQRPRSIADPILEKIVRAGDLRIFPREGSPEELRRLLLRMLREESVLRLAWERFASYDANANRQQATFRRLQLWSLALGLSGTLAALLEAQLLISRVFERGSRPGGRCQTFFAGRKVSDVFRGRFSRQRAARTAKVGGGKDAETWKGEIKRETE